MTQHELAYGSEQFDFALSFADCPSLKIVVEPSGRVAVVAPVGTPLDRVLGIVKRRAGWIVRQRDMFGALGPIQPAKRFVNGETHRYLGRQYRLRITEGQRASVRLVGRYFEITTPLKTNQTGISNLLQRWYRQHAEHVFAKRVAICLRRSYLRELPEPTIAMRRMKRRWGSCTRSGMVLLNLDLVKTPLDCIDYVITHELCHLIEHHHGPKFYRLLGRCMPDWERRRSRLNTAEL